MGKWSRRCHEEYTTAILENRLLKKNQFHVLFDHLEALYENHGNLAVCAVEDGYGCVEDHGGSVQYALFIDGDDGITECAE